MKKVLSVLSVLFFSMSFAYAECKVVPVITGEFTSETLFDPTKSQIIYEKICNQPIVITEEFIVDPTTLEVRKDK